jgi:hypothetical protein
MEKIKGFLLSLNYNVLIFFIFGVRITLFGANIGDALAIAALCGLMGFYKWLEHNKEEPLSDKIEKELTDMKAHVSGLMIKNSIKTTVTPQQESGPRKFF